MNLYRKIILVLGAAILLLVVFTVPTKDVMVNNPAHVPYSKATTAYIKNTVPDYNLMFFRVVGVAGVTGVAYVLARKKEEA